MPIEKLGNDKYSSIVLDIIGIKSILCIIMNILEPFANLAITVIEIECFHLAFVIALNIIISYKNITRCINQKDMLDMF